MNASPDETKPIRLAIICNSLPPYRVHFHQRVAREMRDVQLFTLCTHAMSDGRWAYDPPAEINASDWSMGQPVTQQGTLKDAPLEWRRGGRIIRWMRQQRINAVLCNGYNDAGRIRIIWWCHRAAIPCFLWSDSNIRGELATGVKQLVKQTVVKAIVRQCTALLPCGSQGVKYYQRYGAPPEKIFLAPCEPDYDLIETLPEEKIRAAAEKYGLASDRRRFIFSGRLVEAKRPDLIIDAFASIAKQRLDWDLVIAGDGHLRAATEARIPQDLKSRVRFTGFISSQDEMTALYKLSDILVLPSDYEPWALVVNEAAAAGLAIICTDLVGAAAELVRDGENGALVAAGDLRALSAAMARVSGNEINRMKAASAGVLADWRRRGDPIRGLQEALNRALFEAANTPPPELAPFGSRK
jgi:glycosyltransferase involved in cell wall biosynthesis